VQDLRTAVELKAARHCLAIAHAGRLLKDPTQLLTEAGVPQHKAHITMFFTEAAIEEEMRHLSGAAASEHQHQHHQHQQPVAAAAAAAAVASPTASFLQPNFAPVTLPLHSPLQQQQQQQQQQHLQMPQHKEDMVGEGGAVNTTPRNAKAVRLGRLKLWAQEVTLQKWQAQERV
jgi:hypothetical protein